MNYVYDDGRRNGPRFPALWLIKDGKIHQFGGQGIPGIVAISSSSFTKNGKWSSTTYQLELADGVKPCFLLASLHQKMWPENTRQDAYRRFKAEFDVIVYFESFDVALEARYPDARKRMIEGETALDEIETHTADEARMVEISTEKAARRDPHTDILVRQGKEKWVVAYDAPVGTEVAGVFKVVSHHYHVGRGEMVTTTLAVTEGVTVEVKVYEKDGEAADWALGRNGTGQL